MSNFGTNSLKLKCVRIRQPVPRVTCRAWMPSYIMYMCVAFMGTDYFPKHSQNTQMLCYAKQCCFPNKPCFMSEPAEQGLDRVSVSDSRGPCSLFLSPARSGPFYGEGGGAWTLTWSHSTHNTADPSPGRTDADLSLWKSQIHFQPFVWAFVFGPSSSTSARARINSFKSKNFTINHQRALRKVIGKE